MGLRVVRWEFDSNDMRELLRNPELLPILATRMPPPLADLNPGDDYA